MAINLYGKDSDAHLQRLQQAFGTERVVAIRETRQNNSVVLAWVGTRASGEEPMTLSAEARRDLAGVFATVRAALADR